MRSRIMIATAFLTLLSCTYTDQQSAIAAEEIIVKFAGNQAINETIVRAFDDRHAEASLRISVEELSEELGVPFVYSRLTSGREIIVEIPVGRVYDTIAERLRKSDKVETLVVLRRASSERPNAMDEILVTLDAAGVASTRSVDANTLGAELVGDERFPVHCELRTDRRLAVTPDFEQLVEALVKKLASRPDVDYAQPNYRVRHYDNSP